MHSTDTKRAFDVIVAGALLLVSIPVIAALAALSAVSLRAWPFFVQERVGLDGGAFRFFKIRTLPTSCETYAAKTALSRIPIPLPMRVLRATHLDELPQLWLVLTGRMSLVGPRPEMAVLHARMQPEAAAARLSVRPGLTGLWQVSAHCDGLICDRTEYDRLYVQHRNLRLDLWILWRTVAKVALGRRTHLFEVPMWAVPPVTSRAERRATDAFIDLTDGATQELAPATGVRPAMPVA